VNVGFVKRYKTVELIVEETKWLPRRRQPANDTLVAIKVALSEVGIRRQVKQAGGMWNGKKQIWELRYDQVVRLGLQDRLVQGGI
jgi:hypothetical protein